MTPNDLHLRPWGVGWWPVHTYDVLDGEVVVGTISSTARGFCWSTDRGYGSAISTWDAVQQIRAVLASPQ